MTSIATWLAAFATVAILLLYETSVWPMQQHQPERIARRVHASLLEEWFVAVSSYPGSEILAVLRSFDRVSSASAATSGLA